MERNQEQFTLIAPHVKKPTIQRKDVGREPAHTSNPRETKLKTTLQRKTQTKKESSDNNPTTSKAPASILKNPNPKN